jgi:hypothetical protein
MRYFACENLEGTVFAKGTHLGFLVEFLCSGCHGELTVWLMGKLREK